jgi:hypothetical protein
MQFSPRSVLLPFRSSVLQNPQSMFLPQSERPSFAPEQHNWQNYNFIYFNLQFFWYETRKNMSVYCILYLRTYILTNIRWKWTEYMSYHCAY